MPKSKDDASLNIKRRRESSLTKHVDRIRKGYSKNPIYQRVMSDKTKSEPFKERKRLDRSSSSNSRNSSFDSTREKASYSAAAIAKSSKDMKTRRTKSSGKVNSDRMEKRISVRDDSTTNRRTNSRRSILDKSKMAEQKSPKTSSLSDYGSSIESSEEEIREKYFYMGPDQDSSLESEKDNESQQPVVKNETKESIEKMKSGQNLKTNKSEEGAGHASSKILVSDSGTSRRQALSSASGENTKTQKPADSLSRNSQNILKKSSEKSEPMTVRESSSRSIEKIQMSRDTGLKRKEADKKREPASSEDLSDLSSTDFYTPVQSKVSSDSKRRTEMQRLSTNRKLNKTSHDTSHDTSHERSLERSNSVKPTRKTTEERKKRMDTKNVKHTTPKIVKKVPLSSSSKIKLSQKPKTTKTSEEKNPNTVVKKQELHQNKSDDGSPLTVDSDYESEKSFDDAKACDINYKISAPSKEIIVLKWFHGLSCPEMQKINTNENIPEGFKNYPIRLLKRPLKSLNFQRKKNLSSSEHEIKSSESLRKRSSLLRPKPLESSQSSESESEFKKDMLSSDETNSDPPMAEMYISDLGKLQIVLDLKSLSPEDIGVVVWLDGITDSDMEPDFRKCLSVTSNKSGALRSKSVPFLEDNSSPRPNIYFPSTTFIKNLCVDSKTGSSTVDDDAANLIFYKRCNLNHVD